MNNDLSPSQELSETEEEEVEEVSGVKKDNVYLFDYITIADDKVRIEADIITYFNFSYELTDKKK
jgi:hypothetical protein